MTKIVITLSILAIGVQFWLWKNRPKSKKQDSNTEPDSSNTVYERPSVEEVLEDRRSMTGGNLSISFSSVPLLIVEGRGSYLMGSDGRSYLDTINNVATCGHSHPRVVRAISGQLDKINTNSRYLHPGRVSYMKKLLRTFPGNLEVVFLVCSGSEANDLALRLARAYTGGHDVIVLDGAYHGHTIACIECSPYKYEGPGGFPVKDHIHKVPTPDTYRGRIKANHPNPGRAYAEFVKHAAVDILESSRKLAAIFVESAMGCAGQIVPPQGYLKDVFAHVRAAGGVCVADEVQVGFGRAGDWFWAFEAQEVVPDIVTLGKPIGNGYPMGAVVTTRAIADAFSNGMEYFNTGGGSTAACVAGEAVLDAIEKDGLQANAKDVGHYVLQGLQHMQAQHDIIGDVRGLGLFIGIELVEDRETLAPAAAKASRIALHCRHRGVLLSIDGPLHNVIKIKPPLCFSRADADLLLDTLDWAISQDCTG